MSTESSYPMQVLPVLPLRDVVVYPYMVIPLFVGREKSIKALDTAMAGNKQILLVAQKSAGEDDPGTDQIYDIGSMSNILQLLKLPDGTIKVLVEGAQRARVVDFIETDSMFFANTELLDEEQPEERAVEILLRPALNQFEQYVKLNKKVPPRNPLVTLQYRRPLTPGRYHRRAHVDQDRGETGGAGEAGRARTPGIPDQSHGNGD